MQASSVNSSSLTVQNSDVVESRCCAYNRICIAYQHTNYLPRHKFVSAHQLPPEAQVLLLPPPRRSSCGGSADTTMAVDLPSKFLMGNITRHAAAAAGAASQGQTRAQQLPLSSQAGIDCTCSRIMFSNSTGPRCPWALQRAPSLVMATKSESETKMGGVTSCVHRHD